MDWRETFKNRFGDTFRLCCDDKTLQGGVESFIENLLANREKEIAEEVPNALHEYARWILTDGKNAGPLQRRGKKKEITLQILKHLYKSNSSGLPIADNRMQLGISRVKSAEDYQKYGIKPDSDDLQEEYAQFSFYTRGKFGRR